MVDIGLLVLRLSVGSFMFVHGSQKLLGWFGGRGLSGAVDMTRRNGLRPARLWGPVGAVTMTGGAVATGLGLLGPLGPLCIVMSMLTVVLVRPRRGFFAHRGGNEHAYLYLLSSVAVAISGPGRYSLDVLLGLALPSAAVIGAIAAAALGFAALVAARSAPPDDERVALSAATLASKDR